MCKPLDRILMWIGSALFLMPFQIRIWVGIKMEIRIRIRISNKTMPIHNNALNRLSQVFKKIFFSKFIFKKELACMKKKIPD